jgi:hypothetical protein
MRQTESNRPARCAYRWPCHNRETGAREEYCGAPSRRAGIAASGGCCWPIPLSCAHGWLTGMLNDRQEMLATRGELEGKTFIISIILTTPRLGQGSGLAATSVRRKTRGNAAASILLRHVGVPTRIPVYNACMTGPPAGCGCTSCAADRETRSWHARRWW